MGSMKVFEHPDFGQVRVVDQAGDPWFVAKDVAEILGYSVPAKMYARLDEDEKLTFQDGSSGQIREMILISESGLYNAILGSNKPEAKRFKKWVTSEVLPDIRKHGFHGTDDFVKKALSDPAGMIMFLQNYQEVKAQKEALDQRVVQLNREKAWIESKQVATSMNTASQYSRQNERLRVQIGDSRDWKTVKAIKWLRDEFVLESGMFISLGHKLSKLSTRMGYEKKLVEDSKWGQTKAYHVDVIEAFRYELKKDLNLMSEYRRR